MAHHGDHFVVPSSTIIECNLLDCNIFVGVAFSIRQDQVPGIVLVGCTYIIKEVDRKNVFSDVLVVWQNSLFSSHRSVCRTESTYV